MISEPYKIKEVKKIFGLKHFQRENILKKARYNTYNISSDFVLFDMVARGLSSWSHFQKAAFMIGDESYAGSFNCRNLKEKVQELLGISDLIPTHNLIGAEKLLATTMSEKGKFVLHNRGKGIPIVESTGGLCRDFTGKAAENFSPPAQFGADMDIEAVSEFLQNNSDTVSYFHLEACPMGLNSQPISLQNVKEIRGLADKYNIPVVLNISNLMLNAYWVQKEGGSTQSLLHICREFIQQAQIYIMDGSQDCRSDIGGFISSSKPEFFEKFRNQVVVFEGLHTYGGMTGRAMEVLARGVEELKNEDLIHWHLEQIQLLYDLLKESGVPVYHGCRGIALDAAKFLPHLSAKNHPKFVLASALYLFGGIRAMTRGTWEENYNDKDKDLLYLEVPRGAYSNDQLRYIARLIAVTWKNGEEISGLNLLNKPEFVDEARFEPKNHRLFVNFSTEEKVSRDFEPFKIAIFEPLKLKSKNERKSAIENAGYNTFLLPADDVYIDFLTDSGTSAMSSYQWEGMTNTTDTPYTSRQYQNLVNTFQKILGYNYILPTHQGRAAEHIMSQIMIKKDQIVPGNMYFTTTKLHQEMAGGRFMDVIVDEAHDATSDFPWKGNIDPEKLLKIIKEEGAEKVAYVSFEMSVNMAGGQPFSMANAREISRICQKHNIPLMFDATRCVENSYMIKKKEEGYSHKTVKEILRELCSYGDGCTISCKKDFLVNMGGILACNNDELYIKFARMLRIWEGEISNGGLDPKDMEALHRGLLDSIEEEYIRMRVEQTQVLGKRLIEAGIPIVNPPGSHAIFLDAKKFLPHLDQDEYPAQALASALYLETGVRAMERGNVSKGRNPDTGENYRPALELVRLTIPRRVYTNSHIEFVFEGVKRLYEKRDKIAGLKFVYEPKVLRFFQGRFEPLQPWDF
ncbi:tryptophanase [Candidatus Riflebacteria bacterium]